MNPIIKILMRFSRVLLKTLLVFISYRSVKKVISRYPKPVRRIILFCIRITVFLSIFLFLYSFLSTRVYSIAAHNHTPGILANIFVGVIFIISLVVSFVFTAAVEDIYSMPSRIRQTAKGSLDDVKDGVKDGVKGSAEALTNVVGKSVKSTKETFGKVGGAAVEGANRIYKNSKTATSAVGGLVNLWISKKVAAKKRWDRSRAQKKQRDSVSDKETSEPLKDTNESE